MKQLNNSELTRSPGRAKLGRLNWPMGVAHFWVPSSELKTQQEERFWVTGRDKKTGKELSSKTAFLDTLGQYALKIDEFPSDEQVTLSLNIIILHKQNYSYIPTSSGHNY